MKDLIEKFKADAEAEAKTIKKEPKQELVNNDLSKGPIRKVLYPYEGIMIIHTEVLCTGPNDIPKHSAKKTLPGKKGSKMALIGTSCNMFTYKDINETIATFFDFYVKDENLLYINHKLRGKNQQKKVENEQ